MKVLISRPDKIGDVVLALHGVKQLKLLMPHLKVYMHLSKVTEPLVDLVSFVDGCVDFDEDLEPYGFDASVDLMAKHWTSEKYYKARIPIRIGNSARWFRFHYNRTYMIRRSEALLNEAEYNWQLIRLLDSRLKNTNLFHSLDVGDFTFSFPKEKNPRSVLLMPGKTVSAKPWPESEWIGLARSLVEKGKEVTIILGPAEREREQYFSEQLKNYSGIQVRAIDQFRELLEVLSKGGAYVGPSTGVTHLASALNVPGVTIYPEKRSMHPRRWLPFDSSLKVLSLDRDLSANDVITALEGDSVVEKEPLHRDAVSAFVVCCNEEKNIRRCLESLRWCDEIIVVDSGSTDNTLSICKEYTSKIFHRDWNGHREQKQFALEQCTKKWVVNIDSDEEISMELRAKLLTLLSSDEADQKKINGYLIKRVVYFLGQWWDKGGWYPEYRLRLMRRETAKWSGVDPHERAEVQGKVRKIHEPIYHFTYRDISHQIQALNSHSSLSAERLYSLGERSSLIKLIFRPIFRFIKFYLIKRGFRHGLSGFVVGCIDAFCTFYKYAKLWEIEKKKKAAEPLKIQPPKKESSSLSHEEDSPSQSLVENL